MTEPVYTLHRGTRPLLVSLPHVGTRIPESIGSRLVARALAVEDTDWFLESLYSFARQLGASVLVPHHSRFVIDLNRPPGNTPMYPGTNNTELCPTRFFSGEPLYRPGHEPDEDEIGKRRETWWVPYHDALASELHRLRDQHGWVTLWDGHSIRSELPWLFEGRLPDLNLGTADGASCAPALSAAVTQVLARQADYSWVLNGRFKGGYITRRYGAPAAAIHAVQLEMCWSTYMDETAPFVLDAAKVAALQPVLQALLEAMLAWRPEGARGDEPGR